jgi:hypothetical protein
VPPRAATPLHPRLSNIASQGTGQHFARCRHVAQGHAHHASQKRK